MDIDKLHFIVSYTRMKARLLYGPTLKTSEVIREFNLNKGAVGTLVDRFYWTHEGDSASSRHDVIASLGAPQKGIPTRPSIQIYPLVGEKVISTSPVYASYVQGEYQDYLDNHKHHSLQEV